MSYGTICGHDGVSFHEFAMKHTTGGVMETEFVDETPMRLRKGMTDQEMIESARGPGSQCDQKRTKELEEKIDNWVPGKPVMYWIKVESVIQFGKALQLILKYGEADLTEYKAISRPTLVGGGGKDKTTWVNVNTERKGKLFRLPDWKIATEDLYQWVE